MSEHLVELNRLQKQKLIAFLNNPNGSLTLTDRIKVEAVAGGGVFIRTEPYGAKPSGYIKYEDWDNPDFPSNFVGD